MYAVYTSLFYNCGFWLFASDVNTCGEMNVTNFQVKKNRKITSLCALHFNNFNNSVNMQRIFSAECLLLVKNTFKSSSTWNSTHILLYFILLFNYFFILLLISSDMNCEYFCKSITNIFFQNLTIQTEFKQKN